MVSTSLVLGATCAIVSASSISVSVSAAPAADSPSVPDGGREKAGFNGVNREPCYYVLNEDKIGYDAGSQPAKSFRDCDGHCFRENTCATWSWTDYNGGTCWLKSYHGGSVAKAGAISLSCSLEKHNSPPGTTPTGKPSNVTSEPPFVPREKAPFKGVNGEPCWYDVDTDRPGYDVANKPAGSFRDCSYLCYDVKGCVTWAWTDYNGGTCWLKSSNGGGVKKSGAVSLSCSLEKYDLPPWTSTCNPYDNIDFVGNDIGSKPGKNSHECCAVCDKTQGCSAYAWTNFNGGTCYLKSSVGHVVYKLGVVSSSTKPLYGPVCPFEYDTDFEGNDIGNKPAKDAGVCCSQCKETSVCKAYSWSNYNGGTCWMKSGKGKTSKVAGVISAALFPTRD